MHIFCFYYIDALNLYNKKKITRWLEDINLIFSWWKQYFIHSIRSFVKYSFHHSKIKSIFSRHREYLYIFLLFNQTSVRPSCQKKRNVKRKIYIRKKADCARIKEADWKHLLTNLSRTLKTLIKRWTGSGKNFNKTYVVSWTQWSDII